MKVQELIELLKLENPEAEVAFTTDKYTRDEREIHEIAEGLVRQICKTSTRYFASVEYVRPIDEQAEEGEFETVIIW